VRLLFDTHVWLWWFLEPRRLSGHAKELIAGEGHALLFSAASSWEIAIKYALRKLKLPEPPSRFVPERLARHGMVPLAVEHSHALRVSELPRHHSDPFDRLLVAQAQLEKATVLTADPSFLLYDVDILWAGAGEPPSLVSEGGLAGKDRKRSAGRVKPQVRRRAARARAHPK
jgi:PIN domain nuclease of toxin-antitoxin system